MLQLVSDFLHETDTITKGHTNYDTALCLSVISV